MWVSSVSKVEIRSTSNSSDWNRIHVQQTRYDLKNNKSTGDIPMCSDIVNCDKDHHSLPITKEEVRKGVGVLSKAVSPEVAKKNEKHQVLEILKKMAEENRKHEQQVISKNVGASNSVLCNSQDKNKNSNFDEKNCTTDFMDNKEIISKLANEGKSGHKFSFLENCVPTKRQNLEHVDKLVEHVPKESLDRKEILSLAQGSKKPIIKCQEIQKIFEKLSDHVPCPKTKVGELPKLLSQKHPAKISVLKKNTDHIKRNQDIKQTRDHHKYMTSSTKIGSSQTRNSNLKMKHVRINKQNECYLSLKAIKDSGSFEDGKTNNKNCETCMKGNEEMYKLKTKLKDPKEKKEEATQEIHNPITKLKNQTEERDFLHNVANQQIVDKLSSNKQKTCIEKPSMCAEKNVPKTLEFSKGSTSTGPSQERKMYCHKKRKDSTNTLPSQQLKLSQMFNQVAEQKGCRSLKENAKTKYSENEISDKNTSEKNLESSSTLQSKKELLHCQKSKLKNTIPIILSPPTTLALGHSNKGSDRSINDILQKLKENGLKKETAQNQKEMPIKRLIAKLTNNAFENISSVPMHSQSEEVSQTIVSVNTKTTLKNAFEKANQNQSINDNEQSKNEVSRNSSLIDVSAEQNNETERENILRSILDDLKKCFKKDTDGAVEGTLMRFHEPLNDNENRDVQKTSSALDTVKNDQQISLKNISPKPSSGKSNKTVDRSIKNLTKSNSNVNTRDEFCMKNKMKLSDVRSSSEKLCNNGSDFMAGSQTLSFKSKQMFVPELKSKENIDNDKFIKNIYEKMHHEAKSQASSIKNSLIVCPANSVPGRKLNVETRPSMGRTIVQNSQISMNQQLIFQEEDLLTNSVFLPKLCGLASQSAKFDSQNQKDENNNRCFVKAQIETPVQANCQHEKNGEVSIVEKITNNKTVNLVEKYDMSNNSLLTVKGHCAADKSEESVIKNDAKSQVISMKANELLSDELVNTILTKNYEQCMRLKEIRSAEFIANFIDKIENRKAKGVVKKYRKGKTKIYRLKKMKRVSKDIEKEENLNFEDVFKKLTQDFQGPARCSSPPETFVSTPSSYISVNTLRSEALSTGSKDLDSPGRRLRQGFNKISKDKSLLNYENTFDSISASDRDEIKMKIQDIFLQIFSDLTSGRRAALKFKRRCYENCIMKDGILQLKPEGEALESMLSSTVTRSHMNFKLVIFIMKKIQVLLETNSKLTKRELYYQLKDMISGQGVVDRAINLVSCLLDVGMWALNIIAQKGLIFGNLKIMLSSGETINCNVPGTLIPQDINDIVEIHSDAYFILVVEKEAIFQKLLEEDIPNKLTRPFIMITGKGFPDLNTQLFLRKLWIIMSIPVFILVDADPHGINIMLNYRFGSVANAHVSHHLAVPKARWLGLFPSEITTFNVKNQAMSSNEQKMVEKLLKTPYMEDNPGIVEELKILKQNNLKAGLEGLIKTDLFLSQKYLPYKFLHQKFI
ncbi:unnamed protein product [Acanthoscelides obtectus]|uniref:DNA topoisomerase (ATP-hydrolyzing) n=1 Tax=Acanthoscelides obtectus TaxID=200917 RepID=A0A9P0P3U5_ACAOB|nr:unnamed protein product [Acanthoscelides obtectus]CAK1629690.1 Meiotic recombination protein SPO11 [Acanthoscelides obtectus]